MAMTESALLFLGGFATLTTIALFMDFEDRWMHVLVTFLSVVCWGMFGLSAYDVYIDEAASVSEPIMPFVILGVGMAAIIALLGFWGIIRGVSDEARESDIGLID